MVRFEKLVYEQLVNTRRFKRERIIDRPKKWYHEPRDPALRVAALKLFTQGITGTLFRLAEPIFSRFVYKWNQDYLLQRGLAFEDLIVFTDRELRRDPLYEQVARTSFNPYTWILYAKRRARYYKVERCVRGSYAPEYLREEAQQQTFAESVEVREEYHKFFYDNFMSDMTPTVRPSALQKLIVFEYLQVYGPLRVDAWQRFFYNEVVYKGQTYSKQQLEEIPNPFKCNLQTDAGRRKFESEINRFIELYPGSLTKPGEQFDFEQFYALNAIKQNEDTSKFDPNLIQKLRQQLESKVEEQLAKPEQQDKPHFVLDKKLGKAFFA